MLILFWNGVTQTPATPFSLDGASKLVELYDARTVELVSQRAVEMYDVAARELGT